MKLVLVRHGETEWVREKRYQGTADIPLNKTGHRQARAVVLRIQKHKPGVLYSSELKRARQTAKAISRKCRKKIRIDPRLNELSFGHWEGAFHEEIRIKYPKESKHWYSARWSSRPPGGESLRFVNARVGSFLKDLKKKHRTEKTCVIVTHGGIIRMMVIQLLRMKVGLFWTLRVDPASVTIVDLKRRELVLLNGQAHLSSLKRGGKK